jgi:hypothetical protein
MFLMLRESLKDTDIPHATTLRDMVKEAWIVHMNHLREEFKVRFSANSLDASFNVCS